MNPELKNELLSYVDDLISQLTTFKTHIIYDFDNVNATNLIDTQILCNILTLTSKLKNNESNLLKH